MCQYFRICVSISEYALHGQKPQVFYMHLWINLFYKCVNSALVTKDQSEVVETITEPMEMLQLQRIVFLGIPVSSFTLTNCSIESWKKWVEESYLFWYLGEHINKAILSCRDWKPQAESHSEWARHNSGMPLSAKMISHEWDGLVQLPLVSSSLATITHLIKTSYTACSRMCLKCHWTRQVTWNPCVVEVL